VPDEAPLVDGGAGLVPQGDGWFVVNAADAGWMAHDTFGARCNFEADGRLVNGRPELHVQQHLQLGIRLQVLEPGKPGAMYHRESNQEDFLVLSGECLLIVEGEERRLHAWDLAHCPAGTTHAFVGAGDGPCVILMVGRARRRARSSTRATRWRSATAPALRRTRRIRVPRMRPSATRGPVGLMPGTSSPGAATGRRG